MEFYPISCSPTICAQVLDDHRLWSLLEDLPDLIRRVRSGHPDKKRPMDVWASSTPDRFNWLLEFARNVGGAVIGRKAWETNPTACMITGLLPEPYVIEEDDFPVHPMFPDERPFTSNKAALLQSWLTDRRAWSRPVVWAGKNFSSTAISAFDLCDVGVVSSHRATVPTKTANGEVEMINYAALSNSELVAAYNEIATKKGLPTVSRFSSHAAGLRRILQITEGTHDMGKKQTTTEAAAPAAETTSKPKGGKKGGTAPAAPAAEATSSGRGKTGKLAGKRLFATCSNPRREGSHGHRSFAIVEAQPGITYEAYIEAGGRNNDVHWDIDKGYIEARDK